MPVPERSEGHPVPYARVPDPLTPADVQQRMPQLRATARGIPEEKQRVISGAMLFLGGCLGGLLGVAAQSGALAFVAALVLALVLAVGQVWRQMYREEKAAEEFLALRERWTIPVPDDETRALVTAITDDIAALPAHLRADFAPLMASVRECCHALVDAPKTDRFLVMLRERAALVHQARGEYDALAAMQRGRDAIERFAGDTTGQDLAIVAQIRDALAAVRADLEASDSKAWESGDTTEQ